jgi:purine-binding chemotaxis protein CheW
VGSGRFTLELSSVREIIPCRRMTRLPGASRFVAGLMNVRGTVVTVVDLGARLGEPSSVRADASVMLVDQGGKVVGVAVDEVMDVQGLGDGALEAPTAGGTMDGVVKAVARLGDEVLVVLDLEAILKDILL